MTSVVSLLLGLAALVFLVITLGIALAALFGMRARDRWRRQRVRLPTPEGLLVEHRGLRAWVVLRAPRSPASSDAYLFLHGIGASHCIWRKLRGPVLEQLGWMIELDWPGFGESSIEVPTDISLDAWSALLKEVYRTLSGRLPPDCRLHVVGSSMGASIALFLDQELRRQRELGPPVLALTPALDPNRVPKILLRSVWARASRYLNSLVSPATLRFTVAQVIGPAAPHRQQTIAQATELAWPAFARSEVHVQTFWRALHILADGRLSRSQLSPSPSTGILIARNDRLVDSKTVATWSSENSLWCVEHLTAGHHIMEEDPAWTFAQIVAWRGRLRSSGTGHQSGIQAH